MSSPIPDPPSISFWDASPALRAICEPRLNADEIAQLARMGDLAARVVSPLAAIADRESPRLVGGIVEYHPAYREMEQVAYGSGIVPSSAHHLLSFALGYLFAMAEMSLYCPVCMTDGVARVTSRYGRELPLMGKGWTGAMFLTEQAGGSDVGANETIARRDPDGTWRLSGLKWFCSNADAHAALVTARPEAAPAGTKGLRTFLLLTRGNDGVQIERLKPKLGVRSMPTGEIRLTNAKAEEIGGFGAILEMMNLSRLYNAVASVAVIGRALHEARWYIERRRTFGKRVIEHPLAVNTLLDIEAEHLGAMLMTFETVLALQRADAGDEEAARKFRLLVPIVKAVTGKLAVPCVSEAMELIGGNGYIEDSVMPRLLRDAQVLPIWEGTTNILVLDAVRVAQKDGVPVDESDPRGWVDRYARELEVKLLVEAGYHEAAARLRGRPLGLVPGASV